MPAASRRPLPSTEIGSKHKGLQKRFDFKYPVSMGALAAIKSRRMEILKISAARGARNVRVFGSVARGEDSDRSDIDFLVEMEPGRSLFDLGGLLMDLQKLLGRPVDVVTENGLKQRIRERVTREAIPL